MKTTRIILLLYSYHQCSGSAYDDDDAGDGLYYDLMGKEKVKEIQAPPERKAEYTVKEVSIKDLMSKDKMEYAWRDRHDLSSTAVTALLEMNTSQPIAEYNVTRRGFFSSLWMASSVTLSLFLGNTEAVMEAGNTWEMNAQVCYFIGVTYKNAKTDIMDYEQLRYLYANIKEYEIGYIVEEIIVHYQIAVELFHIMLQKYGENKDQNYASTSYMLYMYTNILHQCKVVQHLCNMLHELRSKYKYDAKETIFDDYHLIKPEQASAVDTRYERMVKMQEEREENERLMKQRQRKKDIKNIGIHIAKLQKIKGKGKKLFELGTTKRRVKGPFPLHYGWSIESWV